MIRQPSKNIIELFNTIDLSNTKPIVVGNFIIMHYKIQDGKKEKLLKYEGLVIAIDNKNISKTFTLKSISNNIEIIRTFPFNSPHIVEIKLKEVFKTKHAKLYNFKLKKQKI